MQRLPGRSVGRAMQVVHHERPTGPATGFSHGAISRKRKMWLRLWRSNGLAQLGERDELQKRIVSLQRKMYDPT